MNRRARIALLSTAIAALLLAAMLALATVWAQGSDRATAWLLRLAADRSGGALALRSVSGNLRDGVRVDGLSLRLEGFELQAERLELAGAFHPLRRSLVLSRLQADGVDALGPGSDSTGSGAGSIPEGYRPPIALEVREGLLRRLSWRAEAAAAPTVVTRLPFTVSWDEVLRLEAAAEGADGSVAKLFADAETVRPFTHRVRLDFSLPPPGGEAYFLTLAGDARETGVELGGGAAGLKVRGTVARPFTEAALDLVVSLERWAVPGMATGTELGGWSGRIAGAADDFTVDLEGELRPATGDPLRLRARGAGDADGLTLEEITMQSSAVDAEATARWRWGDAPTVTGRVDLRSLDPAPWIDGWPSDSPLSGLASFEWRPSLLRLTALDLRTAGAGATVRGQGSLDTDTGELGADLRWTGVTWTTTDGRILRSDRGRIDLAGTLDEWMLEGELALAAAGVADGLLRVGARGDRNGAELRTLDGEALDGHLRGAGRVSWRDGLAAEAELTLAGVRTAPLTPRWPLVLDGALAVSRDGATGRVRLRLDGLRGVVDAARAMDGSAVRPGEIREQPEGGFRADGVVAFAAGAPAFEGLVIQEGASHIRVDGVSGVAPGLRFELDVRPPGLLAAAAGGAWRGSGRVAPGDGQPSIEADLSGSGLHFGSVALDAVELRSGESGQLRADASGVRVTLPGPQGQVLSADSARLRLTLEPAITRLEAELSAPGGTLAAVLEGEPLGDALGGLRAWSGELAALTLSPRDAPRLALLQPAPVRWGVGEAALESACLGDREGAGFCVDELRAGGGDVGGSATLQALPLQWVTALLLGADGPQTTQRLSGEISMGRGVKRGLDLDAALRSSPGTVTEAGGGRSVNVGAGEFALALREGRLEQGRFDLALPGVGFVDLDLDGVRAAEPVDGELRGSLVIRVENPAPLSVLFPAVSDLRGALDARLTLGGELLDPTAEGFVRLTDAGFGVPRIGLRAWGMNLEGRVDARDRLVMTGNGRVGDGAARLALTADLADWQRPALELEVEGEDLALVDLPDFQLRAAPELRLGWSGTSLTMAGRLTVPEATVTPVTTFLSRVGESPDVIVISDGATRAGATARDAPPPGTLRYGGEVELVLGDRVRLLSDLAQADLSGTLRLTWDGPVVPTADGVVRVNGTVSAYGPKLTMENGAVRYAEQPLTQPSLDVRAERDIYGNTQIDAAGVRISGTPRRPVVEAYTSPYTNEDRAWALLITGSDIEYGQGVGAFDIGAYIAPRIYLSYGLGLFGRDNVIGVRYDLRRGLGIKATSGERESGVDATWTIDY